MKIFKILVLAILFLSFYTNVKAQEGYTHFFLRGGPVYKHAKMFSLGLDFAALYHNSWELSINYYRHKQKYENYLMGINYKPVIIRDKNTTLKFRMGLFSGTDLKKFTISPNLGLEFVQSITPGLDIIVSNNNGYYILIPKDYRWRIGGEIGIRVPL